VQAVPPIKYGLGYRNSLNLRCNTLTLTLTLTLNPNPKTDLTLTLKVTKMYAVQNDTRIKFNIELYMLFSLGRGWVYKRPTPGRWNKTVTEVFTVTEVEVWDIII